MTDPLINEVAELSLCGILHLDGADPFREMVGMDLVAEDFAVPACRSYFERFAAFVKDHPQASNDDVALCGWLASGIEPAELEWVTHFVPSPLEWREYVRDVQRLSMRRKLRAAAANLGETARSSPDDLPGAVSALARLQIVPAKNLTFKQLADARADAIANPQPEHTLRNIIWPWPAFDIDFKPLTPGELVVIAARPGIGKSSMCRQIALHSGLAGQGVYFASLEMSAQEVFDGMAVQHARTRKADVAAFVAASKELRTLQIEIADQSRNFSGIAAGAIRFRDLHGLELVVIDYLGRLTDCNPIKGETKASAIGRVTARCKSMAMELGCVVILVAQVNRTPGKEKRDANMGDLKDSSDIEADADRVILLQTPGTFNVHGGPAHTQSPHDPITVSPTWYTQVFQDKGRSVGTADGALFFIRELAMFDLISP